MISLSLFQGDGVRRYTNYLRTAARPIRGVPGSRRTLVRRPDAVLYRDDGHLQAGLDTEFPEDLDHVGACGIGADE